MYKLLILLLLISPILFGQNAPSTLLGEEINSDYIVLNEIIGHSQGKTYVLKQYSGKSEIKFILEKYDQKLNKIAENEVMNFNKKDLKKRGELEDLPDLKFIQLEEDFFLIDEVKSPQKTVLHLKRVDKGPLTIEKEASHSLQMDFMGSYKIQFTPNKSMFLLSSSVSSAKTMNLYVYDIEAKKVWNQSLKLPYKPGLFDVRDIKIDNQGNVFVQGVEYLKDRKRTANKRANYGFKIYSFTNNGENLVEKKIKSNGLFLSDIKMNVDGNQLIYGGFYSDEYKLKIQGAYYCLLNKETLEEEFSSFKKFTMDDKLVSSREKQKMMNKVLPGHNPDVFTYDLVDIKLNEKGQVLLIGEQRYIVVGVSVDSTPSVYGKTASNPRGMDVNFESSVGSRYDDIMVVGMASTGEIEWVSVIPKEQDGICPYCSSFSSIVVGNQVHILYNGMEKNISQTKGQKIKRHNPFFNDHMLIATIDESGKTTRKIVFKDADYHFVIPYTFQVSDNEMLFVGDTKNGTILSKITF